MKSNTAPTPEVHNLQFAPGNDGVVQLAPYPSSLPVCLRFGGRDRRRSAVDISAEGMFVESPDHVSEGELVQVLVALPGDKAIRVLTTVERVVTPDEAAFCGGMPGMGLRFFLMDERLKERWSAYLDRVRTSRQPNPPDPDAREHRVDSVRLSRRREERKEAAFEVRLVQPEGGPTILTRDVSRRGLFLETVEPRPVGERLRMLVRHPVSGRELPVEGVVRWVREPRGEDPAGMGIQLAERSDPRDELFLRFINCG